MNELNPKRKEDERKEKFSFSSMLLTLMLLPFFAISCCKNDTPDCPPCEKVVLVYGVDQGEGRLTVQVLLEEKAENEQDLSSPLEVKKGTTVRFSALHSKSWEIKYWKINGTIIRSVAPTQTFTIDEHKDVRVAFKKWKP